MQITINWQLSDKTELNYGFSQGSSIGPFGFKLYTKPLTKIAQYRQLSIHLYANDNQLYVEFDLSRLEQCIEDIRVWMKHNFLKLNDNKTELIIFGANKSIEQVTAWSIIVQDEEILPTTAARNIGAYMDSALKMNAHINSIIKSCYIQLRHLVKIWKYLNRRHTETHPCLHFIQTWQTGCIAVQPSWLPPVSTLESAEPCCSSGLASEKILSHHPPSLWTSLAARWVHNPVWASPDGLPAICALWCKPYSPACSYDQLLLKIQATCRKLDQSWTKALELPVFSCPTVFIFRAFQNKTENPPFHISILNHDFKLFINELFIEDLFIDKLLLVNYLFMNYLLVNYLLLNYLLLNYLLMNYLLVNYLIMILWYYELLILVNICTAHIAWRKMGLAK